MELWRGVDEHSLGVRGEVKIVESVNGFKVGLNVKDTSFSKFTSLVCPGTQHFWLRLSM